MHNEGLGFELTGEDGKVLYKYSCISNSKSDVKLYKVGKKISVTYATLPLKNPVKEGNSLRTQMDKVLEISVEE